MPVNIAKRLIIAKFVYNIDLQMFGHFNAFD